MGRPSSRDRLLEAACQLYISQGIQETTTKQIAELADVNEVTLFRQFGSKHGLLLDLLERADIFEQLRQVLAAEVDSPSPESPPSAARAVQRYAIVLLDLLDRGPEFVRSVIGESGRFPDKNCQALGRGLAQLNRMATQYLATALPADMGLDASDIQRLARLLNCTILGYAVLEFTSDAHNLWSDREAFLAELVEEIVLPMQYSLAPPLERGVSAGTEAIVADLPAKLVKDIFQRAKKRGLQDYALVYVVFSTGVSAAEIAALERWHYINDPPQHLLQVTQGVVRQVPMNQWVMGQKYGSTGRNPLSQWLNSRKDDWQAVFGLEEGAPATAADIRRRWGAIVEGLLTPQGVLPTLEQARQTWYVDMLMRGVALEDLELLSEVNAEALQPYARRAAEKAALERAMKLDTKPD